MIVTAFDIGIQNFCFCSEEYLDDKVKILFWVKTSLDKKDPCKSVTKILQEYIEKLKRSDTILIEKQMPKNVKAIKIAQHLETFFSIVTPTINVLNYSPCHKTREASKKMTYYQRKKWAVNKVSEILSRRNDPLFLNIKKKDDIADCILMNFTYARKTNFSPSLTIKEKVET